MIQQTSIESYRKLKEDRVLNQRLWEALEFIIQNERVVGRSIPNQGWKRCAALAAMGLIKNDGVAYDADTKRTAKVWVPTGVDAAQVVKPEPKPKSEREISDEMLDELEKKLGVLAEQNNKLAQHNISMMQDIAQLQLALSQKNAEIEALQKGKASGIIKL